jgi:ribose 5-phosphate isomerase B
MRVHIGSDHAGFDLKQHLVGVLSAKGYEVVDHGAASYDAEDDYPVYCLPVGEAVVADPESLGIVIGGSGNGEAIAANKVDGVRCALAWSEDTAKLGRQHNNANVVSVGGRMHTEEEATQLIEWFLETPFSGDPRHERRIRLLADYERGRAS